MLGALLGAVGVGALSGCDRQASAQSMSAALVSADSVARVDTVLGVSAHVARALRTGTLATTTPGAIGTDVVIAEGAVTPGDGGGGVFVWVAGPFTAADDDGGTLIVPLPDPAPGAWRRVYHGPVHADWFGLDPALGDHAAIQKACESFKVVGATTGLHGGIVELGPRTYTLKGPIDVPSWVGLRGAGQQASWLEIAGGGGGLRFHGAPFHLGGSLRDLWIYSRSTCDALVSLRSAHRFAMTDCRLDGAYGDEKATSTHGLRITGAQEASVRSVVINGCLEAALFVDGAVQATTLRFDRCSFRTTVAGPGADVSGLGVHFDDCVFESNGRTPLDPAQVKLTPWIGCGIVIRSGTVNLIGPYFEANEHHDIYAGLLPDTAPKAQWARVTIHNPMFQPIAADPTRARVESAYCVRLDRVYSGALLGGFFDNFANAILLSRNAQGVMIAGTGVTPHRQGPLEEYGGLLEHFTTDPVTTNAIFQLDGKSARRVAGLEVVRRLRSVTSAIHVPAVAGGGVLDFTFDVDGTPAPAFGDIAVASFDAGGAGGVPSGVILSATVSGVAPASVRATFANLNPYPVALVGTLRVDLWRS